MNRTMGAMAVVALGITCTAARADLHFSYTYPDGTPATEVYVHGGKVRIDQKAHGQRVVIDPAAGTMTLMDTARKEYRVMDARAREAMQARVKAARREMQARLSRLSGSRRRALEREMKGLMDAGGAPSPVYEVTGETKTVHGYACEVVRTFIGGRLVSTACMAPAKELGVSTGDLRTYDRVLEFTRKLSAGNAGTGPALPQQVSGGIPVEQTDVFDRRTEMLSAVSRAGLPGATFAIPADYVKRPPTAPQ